MQPQDDTTGSNPGAGQTGSTSGALDLVIASGWQIALFVGVITIALGIIVLAWPGETLKVLSVLLGLQLLLFGVFRLISAFSSTTAAPGLMGFTGLIGIVAGVLVLRHPFDTATLLAVILGLVWIVGGSIDLISALADKSLSDPGLTAISGALSLGAGVLIVSWPAPTLVVVGVIGGLYLVIIGLVIAATALKVRAIEQSAITD